MPEKNAHPAPPDALGRELIFEFLWQFSAFECALKRSGFLRRGRNDNAEADWFAFGEGIRDKFSGVQSPCFQNAVEEIRKLSPKCQIVNEHNELAWKDVPQKPHESDEAYTLRLLKTVRNNLFHGGKYPDGEITEIARNREILKAASAILAGCYELHATVKREVEIVAAELQQFFPRIPPTTAAETGLYL